MAQPSNLRTKDVFISIFIIIYIFLIPSLVKAQVAITVDSSVTYDSNIYLENNEETPSPLNTNKAFDAKENDDIITQFGVALSSNVLESKYFIFGSKARADSLFFGEETDNNRLKLNSFLDFSSTENLIPKPFFINASSTILSTNQAGIDNGASARQSETHTARITLGLSPIELSNNLAFTSSYSFGRTDFLGEFVFGDSADDVLEERGSDFFTHTLTNSLVYDYCREATMRLGANFIRYNITSNADELIPDDRTDARFFLSNNYTPTERLSILSLIGYTKTFFGEDTGRFVIEDDGIGVQVSSDDVDNFLFDLKLNYNPTQQSLFQVSAGQNTGNDITGRRFETLYFTGHYNQKIYHNLDLMLNSSYNETDFSSSVVDELDRFQSSIALKYAFSESLSLRLGYNLVNQNADNLGRLGSLVNNDYEANRVFLSISKGFVGTF